MSFARDISEDVIIFNSSGQGDFCIVLGSTNQGLKSPCCINVPVHTGVGGICDSHCTGWDINLLMGFLAFLWSYAWRLISPCSSSNQEAHHLICSKPHHKAIKTKGWY